MECAFFGVAGVKLVAAGTLGGFTRQKEVRDDALVLLNYTGGRWRQCFAHLSPLTTHTAQQISNSDLSDHLL